MPDSANFNFLNEYDPIFLQLSSAAERAFASDPNTTLIKLRQLGEALAQDLAARSGIYFDENTTQADLLWKLNREIRLDPTIRELFYTLRIEGNKATHQFRTQHREAMGGLKIARTLAVWYHQSFGKQGTKFKPGPFTPLQDPSHQLRDLQTEIDQIKAQLVDSNQQLESNQQLAELIAREKEEYTVLAEQMDAEARAYEQLATDTEAELNRQKVEFERRIAELQIVQKESPADTNKVIKETQHASASFTLNEELTRVLIDKQLINAGWQADTQALTYKKGARPEKGQNLAIAEWPTVGRQSADYVLFAGLIPIAIVEAKRENTNVAGKIKQAERYAAGFSPEATMEPAWVIEGRIIAWPNGDEGHYQVTVYRSMMDTIGFPVRDP